MNHLEGTLERDGDRLVAAVGAVRFGIGRVVRDGRPGERVRLGLRPEEVHANTQGEGTPATCQTAMVLGHHVQIVALLETGDEIVALQRRAGGEHLEDLSSGDKVWLGWSPTAALLFGPADSAGSLPAAEPVEIQA
jgi:hypothetical protein